MAWLQQNWGIVVAPALVAVIDLVMALSPGLRSNGLLHSVYLLLGGKDTPPAS